MKTKFYSLATLIGLLSIATSSVGGGEDFSLQKVFPSGDSTVYGFDFGDVDNDGAVELVLASPRENAVIVLNQNYTEKYRFTFSEPPRDVVIADFKGDGINRLAVGTSGFIPSSCTVEQGIGCLDGQGADSGGYIYFGQVANGVFAQEWKSNLVYIRFATEFAKGDLDNDGRAELFAGISWWGRRLDIYEWDSVQQTYVGRVLDGIGSDVNSVDIAGDTLVIGTACWGDYATRVYKYNPSTSSYPLIYRSYHGRSTQVSAGDLDDDGDIDIVSAATNVCGGQGQGIRELIVDINDGFGGYQPTVIAQGNDLTYLDPLYTGWIWSTVGDLAPWGRVIAIGTGSDLLIPPQNIRIFQYDPVQGIGQLVWQKALDNAGENADEDALEVKIFDFNQDGKNELFVSTTRGLYSSALAEWGWIQLDAWDVPTGGHACTYDSLRERGVRFGGDTIHLTQHSDTYEWNGSSWVFMTSAGPSPRVNAAMAFDTDRGQSILFGGWVQPDNYFSQTWAWDGLTWKKKTSLSSWPHARANHAMAYDKSRGKLVLFGGSYYQTIYRDTWEWNGTSWKKVSSTGPSPRIFSRMAYDEERERVVLFGGQTTYYPVGRFLRDTWEWNGTSWTKVATTGPSPRSWHAMTYDPIRKHIVLFGGGGSLNSFDDTWEWDGSSWTQIHEYGPVRRIGSCMFFDNNHQEMILFGGYHDWQDYDTLEDTWAYRLKEDAELEFSH